MPPRRSRSTRSVTPRLAPRDRPWALFAALALVTLSAYYPAWHGGALWDDDAHLTVPALASWNGLVRIWTDFSVTQQYYPVVSTAFWTMNRLWGHDPFGYHIVNILLHASSAFLVAVILRRLAVPGALLAAVIFALHPVHVESVAWMTELKNTLSGFFYALTALTYLRFNETRSRRQYAAALIAFVLALGSKTVTATFPAAMLVILWWRRGRIDWREDVRPLVPFLVIGVAAGLGTAWLEYAWVGAKGDSFDLTFLERTLLAGRAVWFYAGKLVWPLGLIFMYPRWSIDQTVWWQYAFPIALAAALVGLWAFRGRTRAPLAAALFFCGTLFPAVGFFNVFPFRYSFVADHFQYLASLGVIVGGSAAILMSARRWRPGVSEAVVALALGAPLFVLTFQHSRQYADLETLFRATLAANPNSLLARTNLSALLLEGPQERWAEAELHAREAIRIAPDDAPAHNNLGLVFQREGRYEDSVREFREAIRLVPDAPTSHSNLAISLAALGQTAEAVAEYETALRIFPSQPEVLHNLAKALTTLGRHDEAVGRLREAARLAPESADIQMNLANALQARGAFEEAIAVYRLALGLRPGWGEAQHNLGIALRRVGRLDEAAAAFETAARWLPGSALVRVSFGSLLSSMGRLEAALAQFDEALRAPDVQRAPEIHNEMGLLLMRLGKPVDAVPHFAEAIRLNPDFAAARENMARAKR